ncbi:MAG: alpha/beta hydrolase [Bifidobacteriaceae bacterium]|jgi:pimeloyl-ACP methyl ester carboxylesterase|nr:alpha/beta hydrolase [Bifidobacteriaceae bacterium]
MESRSSNLRLQTSNKNKDYLFFKASDGQLIPFKISGEGKPLVLVHGLGGDLRNWDKVIPKLEKSRTVLRFDQRGHGKSKSFKDITIRRTVQDIEELTKFAFGDEKFALGGHSMGGITTLNYIKDNGCKRLTSAILIDTTPCIFSDSTWDLGLYHGEYTRGDWERDMQIIKTKFISFYAYFLYRVMTQYNEKKPPISYDEFYGIAKAVDARTKLKIARIAEPIKKLASTPSGQLKEVLQIYWQASSEYDTRKTLPKINVPTLIIYASPGSLFAPKLAKWMGEQIKKAPVSLQEIPNSSHLIIPLKAGAVGEKIATFLNASRA